MIDGFLVQAEGSRVDFAAPPASPVLNLRGDREAFAADPTPHDTYRLWEIAGASHQDLWIGRFQVEAQAPRVAARPSRTPSAMRELFASAGNYGEQVDPVPPCAP